MKLCKIVMPIKWFGPERWRHLVVPPGGIHLLMSFIGRIGVLLCGSSLEEMLTVAFSGFPNILPGKAWPKSVRGLTMVIEALLELYMKEGINSPSGLQHILKGSCTSRTDAPRLTVSSTQSSSFPFICVLNEININRFINTDTNCSMNTACTEQCLFSLQLATGVMLDLSSDMI